MKDIQDYLDPAQKKNVWDDLYASLQTHMILSDNEVQNPEELIDKFAEEYNVNVDKWTDDDLDDWWRVLDGSFYVEYTEEPEGDDVVQVRTLNMMFDKGDFEKEDDPISKALRFIIDLQERYN